jgi:hypothetical protein
VLAKTQGIEVPREDRLPLEIDSIIDTIVVIVMM